MAEQGRARLSAKEIAALLSLVPDAEHLFTHEWLMRDFAEIRERAAFNLAKAAPNLLDEVQRSRALLKRLERSPREGQGSYGWFECPDCRRSTMTHLPIEHAPGCELAALISG